MQLSLLHSLRSSQRKQGENLSGIDGRNRKHIFVFFTAPACQGNLQPLLPREVLVCPAAQREREWTVSMGRLDGWIKWKRRNTVLYQHCKLRNKTSTVRSRQPCLLTLAFCNPSNLQPTPPSPTHSTVHSVNCKNDTSHFQHWAHVFIPQKNVKQSLFAIIITFTYRT